MSKIDIDTNDNALITNVARYEYLALLVDKTEAQKNELAALEILLTDYKRSAAEYNANLAAINNNSSLIGGNTDRTSDVNSPKTTTIASQEISFTSLSTDTAIFTLNVGTLVTGGAITIKKDTDTPKPFTYYDGTPITNVPSGYLTVVETPAAFIQATNTGSVLVAIHRGTITIADGATAGNDLTINLPDADTCIARCTGVTSDDIATDMDDNLARLQIIDETNIRADRGPNDGELTVYYEIEEYDRVFKKYTVDVTIDNVSKNVILTDFTDPDKMLTFMSYKTNTSGAISNNEWSAGTLLNVGSYIIYTEVVPNPVGIAHVQVLQLL